MASITNETNGRRTIQFVGTDGKRRSVRLGKVSKRLAEACKLRIEDLVSARKAGMAPSAETTAWLESLDGEIFLRLVAAGLAAGRDRTTLASYIDGYIARRTDTKHSTRTVWRRSRKHLVDFFGEQKLVREISPGEADRFRLYLSERGLAEATVRRTIGIAKQFFHAAVRDKLITENPFADLVAAVKPNKSREYFVTRSEIERVLEATEDPEWRLLIALARYGALRVPSEPLAMTWGDIDLEKKRIRVPSPKTEHHDNGASRLMPLFPELELFINEARDAFRPATIVPDQPVILRYRDSSCNLRTRLLKDIRRVGLEPWPRIWQNMRATRETELVEQFLPHVVSVWVGHRAQTDDGSVMLRAQANLAEFRRKSHQQRRQRGLAACLASATRAF